MAASMRASIGAGAACTSSRRLAAAPVLAAGRLQRAVGRAAQGLGNRNNDIQVKSTLVVV
jgi:hypothetical protein